MEKFIVSARKYRPATFASVVGQGHITSTLQNAMSRDQLAHAYIFCGPRGVGKTTCARILAKAVNCMNRTPENEACNECPSCVAFDSGASFSIHELDAASNTSVDNIRSLNEQVRIMPQLGKYSIYIIDEVHMLSTSAFNAFLKTLEEPPAHVIFILATTEKHKILPTILSRCQTYEFKRITIEDVVKYLQHISLKEKVEYDDESLHLIASKADGCMRDALSMFDKVVSFCGAKLEAAEVSLALNILDYDTYFGFTSLLKSGDYQSALIKYDEVLQKGFDTQSFIGGLGAHLRNILVAGNDSTGKLLEVTGNIAKRYKEQASQLNLQFLFKALEIITSLESALRTTLSQRLTCEFAILKMCNISGELVAATSVAAPSLGVPAATAEPKPVVQPVAPVVAEPKPVVAPVVAESIPVVQQVAPVVTESIPVAQPVAPTVKSESEGTAAVSSRARLGITSIKNIKEAMSQNNTTQSEKKVVQEEVSQYISAENEEAVLKACRDYAELIEDTKTRISLVLKRATIVNGKIGVIVPSSILEEDIVKQKHELLAEIKKLSRISGLDFDVTVDDSTVMVEKQIYVKNEDKLAYLQNENPSLPQFMKELDLHTS